MLLINERLERLWQQAGTRPLVCIQAPGGYGKTTAAAWWAEQSARPTIWMYLERDPGCRHPQTWLTTLAERMADVAGMAPPEGDVRASGIARLAQEYFRDGLTIVLDDLHLVANPDLLPAVSDLCERLAPHAKLVITSRQTVALPVLHRWLARRQAVVITERELQLGVAEVASLLQVSPQEAAEIHQRTNGWLFALNLIQDLGSGEGDWAAGAFREHLGAYLFRELLADYPPETVRFMQISALLDGFAYEDCLALGLPETEASLQRLRQGRLLQERADGSYGYHALFREALVEPLPPEARRHWQLTIARYRFERHHQGCLPLFVAAGAWQELARAVLQFHFTDWVEYQPDRPTLRYWVEQMPAIELQDDAWFLLAYWVTYWRTLDNSGRLGLLTRVEERVAASGDELAQAYALMGRAAWLEISGDLEGLRQLMPRIEALQSRWPPDHPIAVTLRDPTIKYYLYIAPDRDRWEAVMADLLGAPLLNRGIRQAFFNQNVNAAERYLLWGEHVPALRHLRQAAMIAAGGLNGRSFAPVIQAMLSGRMAFDPPIGEAVVAQIFDDEAADAQVYPVMAAFARAEAAFHQGDREAARRDFETVVAYYEATQEEVWPDLATLAGLRIGEHYQTIGQFDRAQAAYLRAQRSDRSAYETGNLHFHLAWLAWDRGDVAEARMQLQEAESRSRKDDSKLLLTEILLLKALVEGAPPSAEALTLLEQGDFRYAIARTFAPGLALLDGAAPASGPRVRLYTLGAFKVFVDGQEIAWKRFNSQLVLLDLLLYRDGSAASLMEQRYWAPNGNVGIRTDIQVLRQTLEPGTPGRESRYLRLFGGKYRWMADKRLYWWDAEAFEELGQRALAASQPEVAAAARKEALSLYKGSFVPDLEAFKAFDATRQRLHQLHQRLLR